MPVFAHIGNIPVEEYGGFLVPIVALCLYGREWGRRRRRKVARLPAASEALDEQTVELVLASWAAVTHGSLGREQVALMYPPGPDGVTTSELAQRIGAEEASVALRLEELGEFGYVEYEADDAEQRIWLTVEGIHLLNITEDALLSALGETSAPAAADPA